MCGHICVFVSTLGTGDLIILLDLTETLPWIELDISKAWHGRELMLSLHCFIYHPKVCLFACECVCVHISGPLTWVSACSNVVGELGEEIGEKYVCVNVNTFPHMHVSVWSEFRIFSSFNMWYFYHKDSGQVKTECDKVCVYSPLSVRECVCFL